eukprot:1953106-Rhodomonas_salina.4
MTDEAMAGAESLVQVEGDSSGTNSSWRELLKDAEEARMEESMEDEEGQDPQAHCNLQVCVCVSV